jgi:hypothetical protein
MVEKFIYRELVLLHTRIVPDLAPDLVVVQSVRFVMAKTAQLKSVN